MAAQLYWESSSKPPQRDLSDGIGLFWIHFPNANLAKSCRGSTARSILLMLKRGGLGWGSDLLECVCWLAQPAATSAASSERIILMGVPCAASLAWIAPGASSMRVPAATLAAIDRWVRSQTDDGQVRDRRRGE